MGLAMRAVKRFGSVTPQVGARTQVLLASSLALEGVSGQSQAWGAQSRPTSGSPAARPRSPAGRPGQRTAPKIIEGQAVRLGQARQGALADLSGSDQQHCRRIAEGIQQGGSQKPGPHDLTLYHCVV